ncbi:MAG: 4-demethylwyosine synthase TYW1 [Sulfolobales archaeon]|nr:4-demethylwyosine synthase TYW1 [Sulfolobales archaeon]MCX8199188.1 4-demethylwyosine synthase TYW1 [Sulfolobales archaeon]
MVKAIKLSIDWSEVRKRRVNFWKSGPTYRAIYEVLIKQGYHLIGTTGAVKRCYWTKEALIRRRFCYKCLWYGIESHRCIQMTPAIIWCWNRCLHCWRLQPDDLNTEWDELKLPTVDDPEVLVEESIITYRNIISGFKGNPSVDRGIFEEAVNPKHVAISLAGEPTVYPRLSELIKEYHDRGLTTFLVTRGVRPDVISGLGEEPTQLYLSFEAWNKEMYNRFNRPLVSRAWDLISETIDYVKSFKNPTVFRITLVKGFNMSDRDVEGFAKLVERGNPTYVEVKAYMYMGRSRSRLTLSSMPSHMEVKAFAKKLADRVGYRILSESIPSRIVLLSRIEETVRHGKGCIGGVEEPEKWCRTLSEEYEEAGELS